LLFDVLSRAGAGRNPCNFWGYGCVRKSFRMSDYGLDWTSTAVKATGAL
jgi:hypothetical protein